MATKICRDCKEEKPITDYYKRSDSPVYKPMCKSCCNRERMKYPINTNYIPRKRANGFTKLSADIQTNIKTDMSNMTIKQVATKYNIKYTTMCYWNKRGFICSQE